MNLLLRKTGNSTVTKIPNKIKEIFGAEIGETEPKFEFDRELGRAMNHYDELLKELGDRWGI